jgi:signal transduction histidine kinase
VGAGTIASVTSSGGDDLAERLAALGEIAAETAHELQNVLQVISSSAYVARVEVHRGNLSAADHHLAKIEKNARTAHAIVDDVMTLARGDALEKQVVPVASVLAAARADMAEGAAHWDDRIEPAHLEVRAHPGLAARLFHVLYDNAAHASAPRAPTVTTRARAGTDRLIIEVTDDGPGVPASIAPHIFDPLVRARSGGTGLGLALARRIVLAHGGSIALVAGGPGAAFRVELPIDS